MPLTPNLQPPIPGHLSASPHLLLTSVLWPSSTSLGHEYYDPVELMEGVVPETERTEELEYEVGGQTPGLSG